MEAVPKLPLISFELKVSPENTHFGPKLKQYIAEAYREDPDSYSNEIHQLEGLRSAAVRATSDAAGLSALVRYYCQLRAMQSRFPMTKGAPAACTFAWKDLYANMSYSLADIKFEMACILYNIGALHTQLGSAEPRTTADSLKSACQHYQYAAWAFQFLREQNPLPSGADISTDILPLLQEICFAQAQECILDKSIQDTRKPSVIGAVATQVLYFYKNSLAQLGPSGSSDTVHEIVGTKIYNSWYRYLSFKMSYIGCIVCLYQGISAEEQQKMGERVAFYQQAVDKLAEARKLAKYIEPVQVTQDALTFTNDVVEGKRKAAKNENEFIYHEEVPEKDMLSDLKPVCLVSAVPINFNDPEVSGPDIFGRLVPMGAHEASSLYSEEKAKLLRHMVSQAEAKDSELTEFMSSLQLDQLDVLDSDQKIPQEIVDRCAAMNAKADIIQNLVDSMNSLAEIISDVEHSLEEIKSLIQEETLKEKEYQKQMGPRPPSIVQTEISREYHKYQEAHSRTNESNQVLHKAMTLHITNLRLLSQPLDVLQTKIPSIENIEGLDRDTMKEMRRVVGKAKEMQKQRDSLVQQLRTALADDDVTAQLLARSNEPLEDIFKQEMEKHTPTVKIIEQNLAAQENIINKLTSLYASYGDSRRLLSDVLRKREGLINALITSYDTHAELLGKSQKGLEFYKKLSHNVNGLLTRVRSVCQVQREERAQLMATQKAPTPVTSAAAKPTESVPAPPASTGLKLKDYLPYMKSRTMARNIPPHAQMEHLPNEAYYPETIYPTSVRPAPVGSEATDLTQPNLPDGVVLPQGMQNVQNPYARYAQAYAPTDNDPYTQQANYAYPMNKFGKPEENYSYTSYTPPQYSSQMPDPQTYTNPYYSATHNNSTAVTDSQNPTPYSTDNQTNVNATQYNVYNNPYNTSNQPPSTPDSNMAQYTPVSQDFNASFAQMQISAPKNEPVANYGGEYGQTQFSVQYPQSYTPNMATYSSAGQNSNTNNTNIVGSPMPADNNYPYVNDPMAQYGQTSMPNVSNPTAQYGQTSQNVSNPMAQYGQTSQNVSNSSAQYGQSSQNVSNPSAQYGQSSQNVSNPTAQYGQSSQNVLNPTPQYGQTSQIVSNPSAQYGQTSQNVSDPSAQYGQTSQNVSNPSAHYGQTSQNVSNPMAQYGQNVMPNTSNPMAQYDATSISNVINPQYSQTSVPSDPAANTFNPQAHNQMTNFPNAMQNVSTPSNQTPNFSNQQNISGPSPTQYFMSNTSISAAPELSNPMQHSPNFANTMQNTQMSGPTALNPNPLSNPMQAGPRSIPNSSSAIPNISGYGVDQQYPFSTAYESISQGYVYTNADSTMTSTNVTAYSAGQPYCLPNEATPYVDPSLAQLDALDKPIKSHVTGEALSTGIRKQIYNPMSQMPNQSYQPTSAQYPDQSNTSYGQAYQNHPGYTYNATSGSYDYNYGSQNTNTNYGQSNVDPQSMAKDPNWNAAGVYTSAGPCQTVQSPSDIPPNNVPAEEPSNSQIYYNLPYGYLTVANQANEVASQSMQVTTNYGANVNCSTYMQSGPNQDTSVTFTTNQVPTAKENVAEQPPKPTEAIDPPPVETTPKETPEIQPVEDKVEEPKPEPTAFDLLSEIDFTVKHKPLMPEIKVPQISEKAIFKPSVVPKVEPVKPVVKEEIIERPAKRDLFSDPSLLNSFTQEVKNLHKLTDSLTNKTPSGLTVLDSKWKSFQDTQAKENMTRSKSVAMRSSENVVTGVVPYDDSRLTLKSDPDAYINASYYKQLASWCIPIVISKCPQEKEYTIFWKAMLENKITCIVCLLSEIEMSGNAYWPTAKGQSIDLADGLRVTLEDVTCNVHWTERKLTIALGKNVSKVTHYQINVFPAKIVCPPLVLLADKMLSITYEGRLSNQLCGACIQCSTGAGRSSVLALLVLVMCQVRAGFLDLCDMLDAGCVNLYKHRTNVLEDTKYLADAYRTVLFYAQGVLCSGTTMFNGEAVSVATGASILPPVTPSPASTTAPGSSHATLKPKFSRESFEEMRQAPGLTSGDMKDPLNFLDPLWSLKKK
ncbi:tyrosine-protein phosphatase non-receptor type 23 isoform X2 [Maniola jurtina]|uniref:tyrosine-protein phosphatase non-receptor type 23 isoform X2 n=1 Tax=Maniola jurtina TaxID=191418 RepID=UPI001E68DD91|nr:tyrosine-protein phosphatase non-receptor type 23 isoform X2 [Maniola jurtina]